jgi:solute carrier family 35 protein F1/2
VRRSPLYEVVGQLGMWGVIINGVQASITEHNKMGTVNGVVATVCRFAVELGL